MRRYIYPMVLFTDENDLYTALYPDLNLLASGFSIEDVYARANEYLGFYITSALKYESKIASTSAEGFLSIKETTTQKIKPTRNAGKISNIFVIGFK